MLNITTQSYWRVVGRAAVTTTLGGAAGTMTALFTTFVRHRSWDLCNVCNGTLVGFVSVTAGTVGCGLQHFVDMFVGISVLVMVPCSAF